MPVASQLQQTPRVLTAYGIHHVIDRYVDDGVDP